MVNMKLMAKYDRLNLPMSDVYQYFKDHTLNMMIIYIHVYMEIR